MSHFIWSIRKTISLPTVMDIESLAERITADVWWRMTVIASIDNVLANSIRGQLANGQKPALDTLPIIASDERTTFDTNVFVGRNGNQLQYELGPEAGAYAHVPCGTLRQQVELYSDFIDLDKG